MRVIMVPDLERWRASSSTVANYVWAVLKVRALCGELGHALLEVQRSTNALNSRREADSLLAEAQALLTELKPEANGYDNQQRS